MNIGVSTIAYILHEKDINEIQKIQGLDEVEFVFEFEHEEIVKGDFLVSVHGPSRYVNIASLSLSHLQYSIDELKRILQKGYETVIHEGNFTTKFDGLINNSFKKMEYAMNQLLEFKENILVENIPSTLFNNIDEFFDFFWKFDVNFCLDIPHYYMKFGNFNGRIFLKDKYKEKIKKIHLSNTTEGHDSHLPLKEGNINFYNLRSFLREFVDARFIIESVPRNYELVTESMQKDVAFLMEVLYG